MPPAGPSSRLVALTGATGFVGGHIATLLAKRGYRVRAFARPASTQRLTGLPVAEWVSGQLDDTDALARFLRGADAVVHCAGAVRARTAEDFLRINADATARLAEQSLAQPRPPRFLLISSLAAREPGLSPYASSKRAAERRLETLDGALPWCALRPPAIYGAGDRALAPLFALLAHGLLPALGPHAARFSLIHAEDLAQAVLHWLERAEPARGIHALHDGHAGGYRWPDLAEAGARLRRKPVHIVHIPRAILAIPAHINALAARFLPVAPMLTPGKLAELMHADWVCDNAPITAALGWEPRIGLDEGLARTRRWR